MSSANLQLPYLEPAQAQKHVTVNESLRRLDALVQLAVVSQTTSAQPASPGDGQCYILPAGKAGAAWGAMSNLAIAYWRDGAWEQITPKEGWRAYVKDADITVVWNGAAWISLTANAVAKSGDAMSGNLTFTDNLEGVVFSSGGKLADRASPETTLMWAAGDKFRILNEAGTVQLFCVDNAGAYFGTFDTPFFHGSGHLVPNTDNAYDIGSASRRMRVIFAGTGTINTSDAREKTELAPIPDGVQRAMRRVLDGIGVFQFLDSVAQKGVRARRHIGVTAQAVRDAFLAEGEDPERWGLFCADPVEERRERAEVSGGLRQGRVERRPVLDEKGEPQLRLGLRYDEIFALALAVLARREA
jgi:hypothetical protein